MSSVRFNVVGDDGDKKVLDVVLPAETWRLIEDVRDRLAAQGRTSTTEEIAAEILGIGLSMTHGVG